jgi:hypothetical protein
MGWERRGNGLYYYNKKREGKRVVSQYIGTGFSAGLISIMDQEKRKERGLARTQWKKEKTEIRKLEIDIEQLGMAIRGVVRATLLTSGYHPHKGQWRKTRDE